MPVTALVLPVSGPYTCIWNANSLGTQNDDGFVLQSSYTGQEINATDAFGMTLVEAIYRGMNWKLRFRSMEFNQPGVLASMQAFGSTGQPTRTFTPSMGFNSSGNPNIGDRYSKFAQPLVLGALLPVQPQGGAFGSSSNPSFINTLTANGAIVSPNSSFEYLFTSKVREAPFEFVLLPYTAVIGSLTTNVAFTTT